MANSTFPATAVVDAVDMKEQLVAVRALQRETQSADPLYVDDPDKTTEKPLSEAEVQELIKAIEKMLADVWSETSIIEPELPRLSDFEIEADDVEDDTWAPIPPKLIYRRVLRVFGPPRAFEASDSGDDILG